MTQFETLTDRAEIADLVSGLGRWLDDQDFDAGRARTIYTDDVVVGTIRGVLRGIDAVLDHIQRTTPPDERTQHLNTDVLVELDGDRAEVTTNQLVYFFRAGQPPHRSAGLRCAYTATRASEGWRFTRAKIMPLWIQEG